MPYAHMNDNPLPTVPVKWYTVVVTITTAWRTYPKEIRGLTNANATARQIADDTARAIEELYCGVATVQCGPVVFGREHQGVLPEGGFYVDGRRLSLPHSEREIE